MSGSANKQKSAEEQVPVTVEAENVEVGILRLNNPEVRGAVRADLRYLKDQSEAIEAIVNDLVGEYTKDLDRFVKKVEDYLEEIRLAYENGQMVQYADTILELQAIQLPVLMYRASDALEDMGMRSDVAKASYQERFNETYNRALGTIPDKKAQAELATLVEYLSRQVQDRVYKKLKTKLDYADKLFQGLRKVMSKRISDQETFRMENAKLTGRPRPETENEE